MTCTEPGCDKPVKVRGRGLCTAHYARWRRRRPGHCVYCGSIIEHGSSSNGRTHDRCLKGRRDNWTRLQQRIYDAYGARCVCCGETNRLFLTIDHVNGDGNVQRRELGMGNRRILLIIINQGFPPEYQIQCYNCNCGRARNGGICPHVAVEPVAA